MLLPMLESVMYPPSKEAMAVRGGGAAVVVAKVEKLAIVAEVVGRPLFLLPFLSCSSSMSSSY